jgi:hypothetical protein
MHLIVTLSFLLFGSFVYAQDDLESRGPLETRGYTIFQLSAFEFTVPLPTYLNEGGLLFKHSITWINVFNYEHTLVFDNEILRIDNRMFYGVTDRLSVGISAPLTAVGGGTMDTFIEDFHDTFGFDNDTRHQYPRNNFSMDEINYSSAMLISDITGYVRYRLFDNPGLSIGLRVQSPSIVATDWFDHRQFGIGIDLTGFYGFDTSIGSFYLTGMASVAQLGNTQSFGYSLVPYQTSFMVGLDWQPIENFSVIGQCIVTSGCVDAFDYRRWSFEVGAGFRLRISKHILVDIGITENIINLDNSADIGIHLGLTFKY